jgi:hypothetical protein
MIINGRHTNHPKKQWQRTSILIVILIVMLSGMFLWQGSVHRTPLEEPSKVLVYCDAETVQGKAFLTESYNVKGGQTQSDEESYSGLYSSKIGKGNEFGFGIDINNPAPGKAYRVSVWMYRSESPRGRLIISGEDSDEFYQFTELPVKKKKNGWELLRMHFIVPEKEMDVIKIYTFAQLNSPPIYFDDLIVEEIQPFLIPEEQKLNIQQVRIAFPAKSYNKLKAKEKEARQRGLLITEDSDWVKGVLMDKDDHQISIEARLKGDYLDHLSDRKWSLRIKTTDGQTWNRMRTFSIQSPHTRSFLDEWIYHQMLTEADVLNPRFDFIHVDVDSLEEGIYAIEEHFEKQLVEFKARREGPILKLVEDGFWLGYKRQNDFYGDKMLGERMENAFWKSEIKPFKENRTLSDPTLSKQYEIAQNQLYAFKYGANSASDVFDIDRLAKMYALMDVNGAYHGKAWHNQRFYYNPVTTKLEPIGFDGFGDRPMPLDIPFLGYYFDYYKDFIPFYESPFIDPDFFRAYCQALVNYTNPDSLDLFFLKYKSEIEDRETFLQNEYPQYNFDPYQILDKGRKIQALINPYPDVSLIVRTSEKNKTDRQIELYNKHCLPLEVIGYSTNPDKVSATLINRIYVPQQIKGKTPIAVKATIPTFAQYVFFALAGTDEYMSTMVSEWAGFETKIITDVANKQFNLSTFDFIKRVKGEVIITKGQHTLNKPLVISKNEQLILEAGAEIDLIDQAYILSYGPVLANGTTERQVIIRSSDETGRGMTVIQAGAASKLSHTIFTSLNTLEIEGWELTGAITFYESDVEMVQCEISYNQCEDALNIIRSKFFIDHINIHHTMSDGFDSDFCSGEIRNSIFSHTGNDGMDFSGSQITIGGTQIDHAGDKGISVGEESNVMVWNAVINDSNIGVASKDLSILNIYYLELNECKTGYLSYQKKPEFGPAKIIVENEVIKNVRKYHLIETGSILKIGEKEIHGEARVEI